MEKVDRAKLAIDEAAKDGMEPYAILYSNPETGGIASAIIGGFSALEILKSFVYLYSNLENTVKEEKQIDYEKAFVLSFLQLMESRHEEENIERNL